MEKTVENNYEKYTKMSLKKLYAVKGRIVARIRELQHKGIVIDELIAKKEREERHK